jgi:hypothetical protein
MTVPASYQLAKLIRETVWSVEQRASIRPGDRELLALRRSLLLRIAELENDSPEPAPAVLPIRLV